MNVGDRIRLASGRAHRDLLGEMQDQVGVIKSVDISRNRTSVLISFPDVDIYTSALAEEDVEIISRVASTEAEIPNARRSQAPDYSETNRSAASCATIPRREGRTGGEKSG